MKKIVKNILLLSLLCIVTPISAQTVSANNKVEIKFKKGQECTVYNAAWTGDKKFSIKIGEGKRLMIFGKNYKKLQSITSSQYAYSSSDGKIEGEFQDHINSHSYGFFNKGTINFVLSSQKNTIHHVMFCLYDW